MQPGSVPPGGQQYNAGVPAGGDRARSMPGNVQQQPRISLAGAPFNSGARGPMGQAQREHSLLPMNSVNSLNEIFMDSAFSWHRCDILRSPPS